MAFAAKLGALAEELVAAITAASNNVSLKAAIRFAFRCI